MNLPKEGKREQRHAKTRERDVKTLLWSGSNKGLFISQNTTNSN